MLSSVLIPAVNCRNTPWTADGRRPRSNVCERGGRSQKSSIARFQYSVLTDVVGRRLRRAYAVQDIAYRILESVFKRSLHFCPGNFKNIVKR